MLRLALARRDVSARILVPLAAGLLFTAVAAAGAGLAYLVAPHAWAGDVPLPVEVPLVGLFFAVGGYLAGLLLPEQARTLLARTRAALDGLSVGLCCVYTAWLLVFSTAGVRGAGMTAVLLAALAIAVTVATGPHTTRYPDSLPWCALGVALSVGGLTGLTVALDYHSDRVAPAVAALGIVLGAAVTRYGAARLARETEQGGPAEAPRSPGYPLLALPLVTAALATGYHLTQIRDFDRVSVGLSVAAVVVVTTRETLAALDLRRYAARLAAQGRHLRTLVLGSHEVALILDDRLVVRWQSPAAARQLGLSDQEVVGRPALDLLHPDDARRLTARLRTGATEPVEVRLRDGYGSWRETEWRLSGPDPGRPWSMVVHIRDISPRKELERTVWQAMYADRLTSLANRWGLPPSPGSGALIAIELYGLTAVHDVHGPDLGDAVLVETARRLRSELAPGDVPARLGESRFAVLTTVGAVQAHLLASRLLTVLTAPYRVPGTVAHVSACAGLADLVPDINVDEAVRRAELALRATRPGGTGSVVSAVEWYDEALEARLRRRSELRQELPGALGRGELDLAYQPVVALPDGRPVGVEALLRWRHPRLGAVPPAELVPIAEELGLLDEIGHWVLHWACRQLSAWRRTDPRLWVAVNASIGQLASELFLAAVTTALETHQVPPGALVVEVAEPALLAARSCPTFTDVVAHLGQLRAMGVRTAVDSFGTGPTSLSQLRLLPVDLLKVDRAVFGTPAGKPVAPNAIIDVMVKLGDQLGMEVVAHGLEDERDLDVARAAGCRYGQGNLLSRPVPPEHLEAYLELHRYGAPS
jgi:PAS domain S-box-containing protein